MLDADAIRDADPPEEVVYVSHLTCRLCKHQRPTPNQYFALECQLFRRPAVKARRDDMQCGERGRHFE